MDISREDWLTISSLLDQALSLQPQSRSAWVDTLGPEYESLKPFLKNLLERSDLKETGDLLGTIPKFLGDATNFSDAASGQLVGSYRLVRQLGVGGMGSVWLADRIDGQVKRKVALKLPHIAGALLDLPARLARERDLLAMLEHPNIARLYDAGVADDGRPFLALEYVEGLPIDRYCEDNLLAVADRVALTVQVARAAAFAHAHLIVHRDLKPSNILVDAHGQVHLLDFGIAKFLDQDPGKPFATQFVGAALTPGYASPEQIRGESVGTTSDVYSLGIVLYELLTGRRPHVPGKGAGPHLLIQAVLAGHAERPSAVVDSRSLARKLRGDLDTIVLKAIKTDPRERYGAMSELADDLERFVRHEPVRARPDSTWYRARKFVARNKVPVAVAAGALLAVLGMAAFALEQAIIASEQRDRALALSARAEAASDFQNRLITEAAQSEKPVTVAEMLARSETLARADFRSQPEIYGAVLNMLGATYYNLGDEGRAESLLREALQAVAQSRDVDLRAQIRCQHALALGSLGKKSEEAFRTLIAVADDPRTNVEHSAQCLEALANLSQFDDDASGALNYATRAWQRLQQMPMVPPAEAGDFLGTLGYSYFINGQIDRANEYYARAMATFDQSGHGTGSAAITTRNNWATVNDGAGDPRRALQVFEEMLQNAARNGTDAEVPMFLIVNRGEVLEHLGRYAQSIEAFSACSIESDRRGNGRWAAYCLAGQCNGYVGLRDLKAAQTYCDRASASLGEAASAQSEAKKHIQLASGRLALAQGRAADALGLFSAAMRNVANVTALAGKAEAELAIGSLDAAEADARLALARAQKMQAGLSYSFKTGLSWYVVGKTLAAKGDAPGAQAAFQSALDHLSNTVDPQHPALRDSRRLLGARSTGT